MNNEGESIKEQVIDKWTFPPFYDSKTVIAFDFD